MGVKELTFYVRGTITSAPVEMKKTFICVLKINKLYFEQVLNGATKPHLTSLLYLFS